MQTDILSNLLALDIFALTAWGIAVSFDPYSGDRFRQRLSLALFSLVMVRSFYLLAFLVSGALSAPFIGAAEILSAICIIWALTDSAVISSRRNYIQIGLGITGAFSLLIWLVPNFPWQMVLLLLALGGFFLTSSNPGGTPWYYSLIPFFLGLMALLSWLGLTATSQFMALAAYGLLIYVVYTGIAGQRRPVEAKGSAELSRRQRLEQMQFVELSNALSATSGPHELLRQAVQIIGQRTQVDQVVILTFSKDQNGLGQVAAIYKAGSLTRHTSRDKISFNLSDYPLLLDSLESQSQLNFTSTTEDAYLKKIYQLWQETHTGPTLIQPLFLKQKGVGMLLLGNPVSKRPVKRIYSQLAEKLSAQLAVMVIYYQEYLSLEIKAEKLAARLQLNQESRQDLINIIETINDGVIASNREGRIQVVNQAAEHILGQSRKQLLGQPMRAIYSHIGGRKPFDNLAAEFSHSPQILTTYFERGGQAVQGRLMPLRNERQEWQGTVAVLRDVTAEVIADKTKSQFIKIITRELRAPLTTIKGYVDLILVGAAGTLNLQQRHFLSAIQAGADQAIGVVNKTSGAVEEEARAIKLDLREIDIRKIITAVAKTGAKLISARHLQLKLDIPPHLPSLQADEAKLKQILDHLLSNACRFTKEYGEISIRARMQPEGSGSPGANYLIIAVSDNGIGIPPEEQGRIFEPYYRASNELSDIAGGSGLGLAVVKELVEAHGGRIWVESAVGKGSAFQIALPCVAD